MITTTRSTFEIVATRMRTRIEAILERDGSKQAAIIGRGVGISYLFAVDIERALTLAIKLANHHDRRITELLAANNREVERRREAEAIVRDLAEWHRRASAIDGDDFLNGDSDTADGRNGHQEIDALGERAIGMVAQAEMTPDD